MTIEFYTFFWYFIGEDFHKMIEIAIKDGSLPNMINKGIITLLFRISEKENFNN
jgi:hypothetical protein